MSLGDISVLAGIYVDVREGESIAIVGRSGSGKSSLLSCILGLIRPDSGDVVVDGQEVSSARGGALTRIRRESMGMVFQNGQLLPELSPHENVMIAGLLAGQAAGPAAERATELLNRLGVPAGSRSIEQFSGGERQRVAVARALMNRPRLLLADEPTGSLDPQTRDQVIELIFSVPQQFGCGLVVVTHDPVVAGQADRLFELADGVLSEPGLSDVGVRA